MKDFNLKPVSTEKYIIINKPIPKDLIGKIYLRNGSNPYLKHINHHLFDGDGMIHSFEFQDNKIIYHNHWIQTHRLVLEKKYKKPLYIRLSNLSSLDIFNTYLNRIRLLNEFYNTYGEGTANTNIIYHHGKLLALNEMDKPYLLSFKNHKLQTIKRYDFNGKLTHNINAHPKIDPDTSDMITLGYNVFNKMCYIDVFNNLGELLKSNSIRLPKSTIIHDVGITKNKIIILDLPLEFNLKHILLTNFPLGINPTATPRIGLLDKKSDLLEWYTLPNIEIIFHIASSWEDSETNSVIIYAFCYDHGTFDIINIHTQRPRLKKIIINTLTKITRVFTVSNFTGELPVIEDINVGKMPDYIYYSRISENGFDAIVKHHIVNCKEQIISFPKGLYGGECAIFNNYILNIVYSPDTKKSRLLIYDKISLTLLHNINLKCRIPFGFHGKVFTL